MTRLHLHPSVFVRPSVRRILVNAKSPELLEIKRISLNLAKKSTWTQG